MNGNFGFAMRFYTKSPGLGPTWAGLAMSVSVFWEAVTETVMGHVSNHTRGAWGRHPHMLLGGEEIVQATAIGANYHRMRGAFAIATAVFVYDDFMRFSAWRKSIAHGSTMVGMALGALVSMGLAKRFDKRGAVP
jgi:Na+/melibiose symporter-like transporter